MEVDPSLRGSSGSSPEAPKHYRNSPVIDAVVNRHSVRHFLSTPVPLNVVRAIMSAASRAPSGTNFQPWHVHVVTGATRANLSRAVTQAAEAGERSAEYTYAPAPVMEPYLSRRRKVGYDLYKLYGIAHEDFAARKKAMLRNFEFFRRAGWLVLHHGEMPSSRFLARLRDVHAERDDRRQSARARDLPTAGLV
jgi:nitroreductase